MASRILKIPKDIHSGISTVDGDNTAAGMRTCAAQIYTGHRRARPEPARPHILRQAFTLENVSPGKTYFLLDVRWSHYLYIDNTRRHIVTESGERSDDKTANFVTS